MYTYRHWSADLIETTPRWLDFILKTVPDKKRTN